MSILTFIAADNPLVGIAPSQNDLLGIHTDDDTVYDGCADDDYFLCAFTYVESYTQKRYAVYFEWNYTEGRAKRVIDYIRKALQDTDSIEFWHVWLMDYDEFEDRPVVHRSTVSISELTTAHIKDIDSADIWNTPDKRYPNRPSFYCMEIKQ